MQTRELIALASIQSFHLDQIPPYLVVRVRIPALSRRFGFKRGLVGGCDLLGIPKVFPETQF
jgi:hypothetical protein